MKTPRSGSAPGGFCLSLATGAELFAARVV